MREKAGLGLLWLAVVAAAAADVYLAVVPMYGGIATVTSTAGPDMGPIQLPARTLAQVNGSGVYFILLVPVVLAGLPLLAREPLSRTWAAWLSAVLLAGFSMLSAWTIGLYFAPAVGVLLLAAVLLTLGGRHRKVGRADDEGGWGT